MTAVYELSDPNHPGVNVYFSKTPVTPTTRKNLERDQPIIKNRNCPQTNDKELE
jgi:hypothetical protein